MEDFLKKHRKELTIIGFVVLLVLLVEYLYKEKLESNLSEYYLTQKGREELYSILVDQPSYKWDQLPDVTKLQLANISLKQWKDFESVNPDYYKPLDPDIDAKDIVDWMDDNYDENPSLPIGEVIIRYLRFVAEKAD